ncbi:MAG TPA: Asp-tRNA(Asn)/Glu-tRNA(Gln) amidotransferase GatCAB subunit A [Armatimonadetes bacterium]|nr:Asp-tRNA(Asn)/Glu-tRNA(Gln) amidotransferase GatCAB subunit A [Armatimonadota bacterium]
MSELTTLSIEAAAAGLRAGEFTAAELTEAVLARSAAVEPTIGSYLLETPEQARAMAAAADARLRAEGDAAPLLCGIPGALKDLICTAGVRTTAASRMLETYVPFYDAHVAQRLKDAGFVLTGKANLDEFAMGSSTETSAYHTTRNPFCPDCVPGGSSGGSASSVAADQAFFSLGTDTGGSIRQPASMCGVVGLKPTYGRVSRRGVMAMASSLDQVGPFARSVRDTAAVLEAIAGRDELDATSSARPVPAYREACGRDVRGLKIGVPREYFAEGVEPAVAAAVRAAVEQLVSLGAEAVEISLPHTEYGMSTFYVLMSSEVSANLARFDGIRYGVPREGGTMWEAYSNTRGQGFGPEVQRRIMLGTYVLSAGYAEAYYVRAQKVRTLIRDDFATALAEVDAIAAPVSPTTAFRLGERTDDPVVMYLSDVLTLPCSLAGLPGLSVPCGFDGEGKPIGLQLMGAHWAEETLFSLAYALEQSTDWSLAANRNRIRVGDAQ